VTRIISGRAGGRRIEVPPGSSTRPTSDRVREALFSRLEHLDVLHGARVLDLYAGSGALGLEAASRGASAVVLVEQARQAAAVIRRNVASLGDVLSGISVRVQPVERVLATPPPPADRFDLVLLDPPYDVAEDALAGVLDALVAGRWLDPEALVVVERSGRSPEPRWPGGLAATVERRYGETVMWFADVAGPVEVA
jgi:16S rRNA (guanine966-N2)-methyltransferase